MEKPEQTSEPKEFFGNIRVPIDVFESILRYFSFLFLPRIASVSRVWKKQSDSFREFALKNLQPAELKQVALFGLKKRLPELLKRLAQSHQNISRVLAEEKKLWENAFPFTGNEVVPVQEDQITALGEMVVVVDINQFRDPMGDPPLLSALRCRYFHIADALLTRFKADPSVKNERLQNTAAQLCFEIGPNLERFQSLHTRYPYLWKAQDTRGRNILFTHAETIRGLRNPEDRRSRYAILSWLETHMSEQPFATEFEKREIQRLKTAFSPE